VDRYIHTDTTDKLNVMLPSDPPCQIASVATVQDHFLQIE